VSTKLIGASQAGCARTPAPMAAPQLAAEVLHVEVRPQKRRPQRRDPQARCFQTLRRSSSICIGQNIAIVLPASVDVRTDETVVDLADPGQLLLAQRRQRRPGCIAPLLLGVACPGITVLTPGWSITHRSMN
jgi:hypothetical protein